MGLFFDTAITLGVRLLHLRDEAWYVVKEYVGADVERIVQSEFQTFVGSPGFRIEYAHPASSSLDPSNEIAMLLWNHA